MEMTTKIRYEWWDGQMDSTVCNAVTLTNQTKSDQDDRWTASRVQIQQ